MNFQDSLIAEPVARSATGNFDTVIDHAFHVFQRNGPNLKIKGYAIFKIGVFMDHGAHFRLSKNDQLEQFEIICFKL